MGKIKFEKKNGSKIMQISMNDFLGYVNGCSAIKRKKGVVDGYRLRIFFFQNYRRVPFQYFSTGLFDMFDSCEQKYVFQVNKCTEPRKIN